MSDHDNLRQRIRDSAPLLERLAKASHRIDVIASIEHCLRMSIPVSPDDDDVFISAALDDAAEEVQALLARAEQAELDREALSKAVVKAVEQFSYILEVVSDDPYTGMLSECRTRMDELCGAITRATPAEGGAA